MQHYSKRTWAEVHLDRLEYNLNTCKSLLQSNTKLMAVVKANAYGHGDNVVAPFLEEHGVEWFAVSNISEAKHLRSVGVTKEILILGYVFPDEITEACENNIIQTITSLEYAISLANNLPQNKKIRAHIKIDTGMGRIGIKHKTVLEYADEIEKILKLENINVEGIFTHLSVADSDTSEDDIYTKNQCKLFMEINDELNNRGISLEHVHCFNSAGATYHADEKSTLARFGIMLYGLHPNHSLSLPVKLKPVMELKTVVSHVKTIEKGEFVSYGRTFVAENPIKVASLTVGYADGYSRLLSSKAEVLVNGKRAKIIGRVCMDQTMIDVTGIDVSVGDVATLFGKCGEDEITADEIADIYGSIGYEVVCGIAKRVPRVFIKNNEVIEVIDQ